MQKPHGRLALGILAAALLASAPAFAEPSREPPAPAPVQPTAPAPGGDPRLVPLEVPNFAAGGPIRHPAGGFGPGLTAPSAGVPLRIGGSGLVHAVSER